MNDRRARIAELQRQAQRLASIPTTLQAWSALGLSVSILADEQQQRLLHKMRNAPSSPFAATDSIIEPISRIASLGDYCVVCDWSFSDHPATLVPSRSLVASASRLATIFPNGFFVFSSALSSGILISINEDEPNLEVSTVEFD